jgi:hypothetical protein
MTAGSRGEIIAPSGDDDVQRIESMRPILALERARVLLGHEEPAGTGA